MRDVQGVQRPSPAQQTPEATRPAADRSSDTAPEVAEGEAAGYSVRTLERAKKRLGVVARQVRCGGRNAWHWSDPAAPPRDAGERG